HRRPEGKPAFAAAYLTAQMPQVAAAAQVALAPPPGEGSSPSARLAAGRAKRISCGCGALLLARPCPMIGGMAQQVERIDVVVLGLGDRPEIEAKACGQRGIIEWHAEIRLWDFRMTADLSGYHVRYA